MWTPSIASGPHRRARRRVDGRTASLRSNVDIVLRDEQVVETPISSTGRVIDASSHVVMPELIEMHAHLRATRVHLDQSRHHDIA